MFNVRGATTLAKRYEGMLDETELDFMEGLLQLDPAKRMTAAECLKHPYLAYMDKTLGGGGK